MDDHDHRTLTRPAHQRVALGEPGTPSSPATVVRITTAQAARRFRSDLLALTDRLIADLDWVPSGRVMATVAGCRSELARLGVPRDGLLAATEACVRLRMDPPVASPRSISS